jgi:hypothetical protein
LRFDELDDELLELLTPEVTFVVTPGLTVVMVAVLKR